MNTDKYYLYVFDEKSFALKVIPTRQSIPIDTSVEPKSFTPILIEGELIHPQS